VPIRLALKALKVIRPAMGRLRILFIRVSSLARFRVLGYFLYVIIDVYEWFTPWGWLLKCYIREHNANIHFGCNIKPLIPLITRKLREKRKLTFMDIVKSTLCLYFVQRVFQNFCKR
jgi:hypothetical protein